MDFDDSTDPSSARRDHHLRLSDSPHPNYCCHDRHRWNRRDRHRLSRRRQMEVLEVDPTIQSMMILGETGAASQSLSMPIRKGCCIVAIVILK